VLGDTSEVSEVTKKVLQALVNLGYSEKVAKDAIKSLEATKNDLSEQELLKLALAQLSSSRKVGKDA
jgi:Holliday junction resolvasome RuvABC DNA-binding subunit